MATSDPAAPPAGIDQGDLPVSLIDALVQTSFVTMAVLSRVGAEYDLSLTQLRVLAILRDRRVKMSELAGYLGLDKSTISGLVDRAEKRGLIQRIPNPVDGRGVDVVLSAAGTELADRGAAQIARSLSPLTSTLTRAETHRLTALLERMLEPRSALLSIRLLVGVGSLAQCDADS
jgi:DNA-binding MarR family transcriptional regulator